MRQSREGSQQRVIFLKQTYPCGQLACNRAGDMLGGRGTRDLGYLFISHDGLSVSLGWVLIF